ncbi:glycosyltransferase family 4 protein [Parapedobacter tibetensis]|uniref:glycosyltransferase family 4 protein n=1 Tax=Parapedobacter tibetensis TaxID=2972951 RepID=UPI00214DB4E7|nr:glycosyltransferase family 4 protein [Parapedobacter tibetensis]
MKILYINALYSPYVEGGAELSLKLIVEGMQAKGHEVAVLSMVPEAGLRSEWVDGVKVYRAGLKNRYWPFTKERPSTYRRLAWHLRDRRNLAMRTYVHEVLLLEKPDVVSCHNLVGWSVSIWDEIERMQIPIVQVLHDLYLLCPNSNMYKNGQPCVRQCFSCHVLRMGHRARSNKISAVVGISRSILNRFEAYGYFANVPRYVVHNARHIPIARPLRVRKEGEPLNVGYIGTLSAIKGVEWLINQFKASGIDGRLHIAGRGRSEDVQHLEKLAQDDSRIVFEGYVDSKDFYPIIDVLVVPSLWEEPLGMVAIEGLANNLPIIASNRGGLRETVADGRNGILCEPDRPDSLGHALTTLWRDVAVYNGLAEAARQSVSAYIRVERMVDEYEEVLRAVITDDTKA